MLAPIRVFLFVATTMILLLRATHAEVVISEIMYHPQSERSDEEFVELYNTDAASVDLSGWKLTSGVDFTFPTGTALPAGGYLVVSAKGAVFSAKYPTVTNFVAGWSGQLSNSSNTIRLANALGVPIDEVDYADDGDWGERRRQDPPDYGHRGWTWESQADGGAGSLELINVLFDNEVAQNWSSSSSATGTPGVANSVAAGDIAPSISKVRHFPLVPRSAENVTIACRIVDDHATAVVAQLHYRLDGAENFTTATMFDDGSHDDALAGDGNFAAILPPQADGEIVEFYVSARDAASLTRTWPAPARDYTGTLVQSQNCLYQVDDTAYDAAMPIYRIVMRAVDRSELTAINTNAGTPPFPFNPGEAEEQALSHSRFNATFISQDGTGTKLRYLTGVRNRGNGSRSLQPQSMNVQFANNDTWNGLSAIALNTQYTPWQLLGSALVRKAGLAGPESRAVQVRVNAQNPAGNAGSPSYGFYVCNEVQNAQFSEHHFPLDTGGNIYRAQRLFQGTTEGGTVIRNAGDLSHHVPAEGETLSQVDLYKLNYRKETNNSEENWNDLIALTAALAKGQSGPTPADTITYSPDYLSSVDAVADIGQFTRWFAVQTVMDNEETNLSNGDGDDYYLYIGRENPRAKLVPYDLDTILGRSGSSNVATHGVFRMIDDRSGTPRPTPMNAFIKHPAVAPLYYAELRRLLDGLFKPENFEPFCDSILAGVAPANVIATIKNFNAARHAHITTLVPLNLTAVSSLPVVNGFPQSTTSTAALNGVSNAMETRSVKVNGVAATWSAWNARWSVTDVPLAPGINRLLVQAFNAAGGEIDRIFFEVWYDDGSVQTIAGTLAANTTWTAAGGPYQVTASLAVPAGLTLTIEPGTSVFLAAGASINVTGTGRIIAEGTSAQRIRFGPVPGAANWGRIAITNTTAESRIAFAHFTGNGSSAVRLNNAIAVLDNLTFGNTTQKYLDLDASSFVVSNCVFPDATVGMEPVHGTGGIMTGGRGIIRDCFFGRAIEYNDVIDFTGGDRPGPILQVINNVFIGSDDDILDLDGTDTWVEGNIFMHVHRNDSPDSASAISGGLDGSRTSEVTIVGNLFYDMDQVATAKQGNFYTLLNNTVVDQNGRGSEDEVTALLNFNDEGATEGSGMYLEGNVIHSAVALLRNHNTATVTLNNNLLPMPWTGLGSGNEVTVAKLNDAFGIPTPDERNWRQLLPVIRQKFGLQPSSPAVGTGPNGTDKGGVRAFGVSLSGAPRGTTNQTGATLTLGTLMTGSGIPSGANAFPNGSGWTHYTWRLDGGSWSPETAIAVPITVSALADGPHTVEVVGKNDAQFYQDHPDFGSSARVSSVSWVVDSSYTPPPATPLVRINEVLALNTETVSFGSAFPDVLELHNAGGTAADISGWGLTDNSATPFKYTFPAGTILAPGTYKVVYASGGNNVPQPKTGFGLKREGDTLTLTRSAAAGGGIADKIPFGYQLADYSIGRASDGSWTLCRPTFGSVNVLAETGLVTAVKINEWLADSVALSSTDFVELMNPSAMPVDVGLCYMTDNPSDWPDHFPIRQLTFIAPGGYISFKADDDEGQGPDHLNFKLDTVQGDIGLFDVSLGLIDNIVYGPQSTDVSQGRTPNGQAGIAFFAQPTPGGPNPSVFGTTSTATVNLMGAAHAWKYFPGVTGAPPNDNAGEPFTSVTYNDSSWFPTETSAAQLLYLETSGLANTAGFAKTTLLPGTTATRPYQTYYFRTHFNYAGPLANATLTATVMVDDGAVIYLNGVEATRVGMGTGTVTYSTLTNRSVDNAAVETIAVPTTNLVVGDNVLVVEVHQVNDQAGASPSSDVVWGMKLDATVTTGFSTLPVVLNELLPINTSVQNPDGSYSSWVELANMGSLPIDLADMSLSNNVAQPRKFVFPAGTVLPAGASLTIDCIGLTAASPTNTGFSPGGGGGFIGLYHTVANGGGLHDALSYGRQIPNFSLGRTPNGAGPWTLCVPTRGALNTAAALGQLSGVKINEWLAAPASGFDYLELFNTAGKPVALGENYLTDDLNNRTKSLIPPLSFIGGSGVSRWQRWIADSDNSGSPEHVSFELNAATGEAIGLYNPAGAPIDTVSFSPQSTPNSSGRFPDGTSAIYVLSPTPGALNRLPPQADTDGDLIPDAWEAANGLDPANPADADLDPDLDGQSSLAEYLAGTNPRSGSDVFRVKLDFSGSAPALRFTAMAGRTYTVQYKNGLGDTTWTKLADVPAEAVDLDVEVQDNTASGKTQRFYRIVTPSVP